MKKVCFLLFFVVTQVTQCQEKPIIFSNMKMIGEHELEKIILRTPQANLEACGPYFLFEDATLSIKFKYKMKPTEVPIGGMRPKAMFEVLIDDKKKVPTLELVGSSQTVKQDTKALVRLSRKDYEAAFCLPVLKK